MRSFSLSRRNIAANPLRSLLTSSAIALGIAMLLAASILMQAAARSAHQLAVRESAVDLQLLRQEEGRFAASLADRVAALPGVEQFAPSLALTAAPQGLPVAQITLRGVEPEYAALHVLELDSGAFLDRPNSLVLPEEIAQRLGLSLGQPVVLSLEGRSVELVVSGLLPAEDAAAWFAASQSQAAYLSLNAAQTLAGAPGLISQVDISLQGRADLNQVRTDILALVGNDFAVVQTRPAASFSVMDVLVQGLLGLVGVMILFASAFVIFNAFAMVVAGRRREIGALRCLGMTRRQVFRNTLTEAAYLALAGMFLGVLVGIALGWAIQQIMGTLDQVPFAVPWWGLVFSPLIGLLTTLAGAFGPAWQAQRVSPLAALRSGEMPGSGAASHRRSFLGWVVLLLTLLGLAVYGLAVRPDFITGTTGLAVGIVFIIISIVFVLPGLMLPLSKLFRWLGSRRFGAAVRLAVDGISRNPGRSAATAAGLAIGPAIVIFMTGVMSVLFGNFFMDQSSMVHENATIGLDFTAAMQSGRLSVDNFAAYMFNQPLIDPQVLAGVEALAAREGFDVLRYGLLRLPLGGLPPMNAVAVADLEIYTRIGNFDYFTGNRAYTIQQMAHGPVILLPPGDAGRQGVELGDKISLPTSQGTVDFIVAGIGGNNLYMPFLDFQDARRYFDLPGPTSLGIILPPGADQERIFAAIDALLEGYPMLALNRDLDEAVDAASGMLGAFEALLDGLMLLAVVIASLGVVNTITINISERGRELGMLRAVGATRRQVLYSVVGEAAILGLAAAALAAGLGLLLLGAFLLVATPNGYYSMGVIFQWDTLPSALIKMAVGILISLAATPCVAALAAYLPARSAARLDVIEATRSERLSLKALASGRSQSRPVHRLPRSAFAVSAAWILAWRSLWRERTRTILCILAVALGVSMLLATQQIGSSLLEVLQQSEMAQIYGQGLFESFDAILNLVGVGIMAAAGVLILNAFAMGVARRRQEIGALRALGGVRRQVMALVLLEALITASVGVALGLILGPLLGRGVIALLDRADLFLSAFGKSNLPSGALLLAAAVGFVVTVLAVFFPARQAARVSPLEALRAPEPLSAPPSGYWTALVGLLLIVALFIFLALAPPGEWASSPLNGWLTGVCLLLWFASLGLILPGLVGGFGRVVRQPLQRLLGVPGLLAADNLRRARSRTSLTVTSLALGMALVSSMSGAMAFIMDELFGQSLNAFESRQGLILMPIDPAQGTAAFMNLLLLKPEFIQDVSRQVGNQAVLLSFYFASVPELSAIGSTYFTFVLDPEMLRQTGATFFTFQEGDWQSALPLIRAGCGVLITPGVARKNNVRLGETLILQSKAGPVICTVAGIGATFVNASILSGVAAAPFAQSDPTGLYVSPLPGLGMAELETRLAPLIEQYGGYQYKADEVVALQRQTLRQVRGLLNALLLAAVAAGALGVINTSVISVIERRRELGLLRAVGSQRRQVGWMVAGEAALMGLLGGFLGLLAGVGFTLILVLVFGGKSWGLDNLVLWPAAWRSAQPALQSGLLGLCAAPFIAALSAWLPVRSLLRAAPVDVLRKDAT